MRKKSVSLQRPQHATQPVEVPAAVFKDTCLQLIDRVAQSRQEIVVTKHGRPVARLVPFDPEATSLFGCLAGTATERGDIVAPIGESWDADD